MPEGWMGKWLAVGAESVSFGATETLNLFFNFTGFALLGKGRSLILSHTGSLSFIEHKRRRTFIWMRESVDTIVVFVANCWVLVVEKAICSVTLFIKIWLRLLDIFPAPTIHVERVVTEIAVRIRSLEEKPIRAEFCLRKAVHALVVLVALFAVRKESIVLWALKITYVVLG